MKQSVTRLCEEGFGDSGPAGPLGAPWALSGLCPAGTGLSLRTRVAISLGKYVPVLALTAVPPSFSS